MGKHPQHLMTAAILATLATPLAMAVTSHPQFTVCGSTGGCGSVRSVDDDQLASVAGKFTIAGEVVGMSLTMTSSWQSANGQRLEATAGMTLSLPASGRAAASVHAHADGTQASAGKATAPAGRQVYQGQGLHSVNGVTQVIQVAGDDNDAINRAAVRVSGDAITHAGGNGRTQASFVAANGARAEVSIARNGAGISLTLPDAGSARQQVNMAGTGPVHQGIQIAADGQMASNALQLQLQTRQPGHLATSALGVQRSLDMLRGR